MPGSAGSFAPLWARSPWPWSNWNLAVSSSVRPAVNCASAESSWVAASASLDLLASSCACAAKGSTTRLTWSRSVHPSKVWVRAAFWVSVKAPSRECDDRAEAAGDLGIWVAAWSSTFWKVLPGWSPRVSGVPEKVAAPPPGAASTISQAAMTVLTWSAHQRPTR